MSKRSITVREIPVPTEPNEFLVVSVGYQLGGHNWFHGTPERNGYYVTIQKERHEKREGYTAVTFMLGTSGLKSCLERADRFSEPKLTKLAAKLTADETAYADLLQAVAHKHNINLADVVQAPQKPEAGK